MFDYEKGLETLVADCVDGLYELENGCITINGVDISKIKNNICMRRHDIAWIGISFKGTNAVVEVIDMDKLEFI